MPEKNFQSKLNLALDPRLWNHPRRLKEQLEKPLPAKFFDNQGMYKVFKVKSHTGQEPKAEGYPKPIRVDRNERYTQERQRFLQFERLFSQILYPTTLKDARETIKETQATTDNLRTFFSKIATRCEWNEDEEEAVTEEAKAVIQNADNQQRFAPTAIGDFFGIAMTGDQPMFQGGFYGIKPDDQGYDLSDAHMFMNRYFIELNIGGITFRVPAHSVVDKESLSESLFPGLPQGRQNYYNLERYSGIIYAKGPNCYNPEEIITFIECGDIIHLAIPGKGQMQVWVEAPRGIGGQTYRVQKIRSAFTPELSFSNGSL